MALQHLRSSTANKRPVPGNMSDGQLGINTNNGSPGLFFKDSNNTLVKVGPVHVGTTAPNASPASGGTAGNSVGEQWLDTTGGTYVFKVWDGTAWRSESGTFVDVNGDVMTGALGIIAGSAAAPGLYISGDTNSGLYSPGADQVSLTTGGTERLRIDSTGQIEAVSLGTAAAPVFSFTGDPNTGIYSPGADQVAISTNGIGRLFVDSSGVVNIAQQLLLDNNREVRFKDSAGTSRTTMVLDGSNDLKIGASAGGNLIFINGSSYTERLRITSAGLVGIGTSAPNTRLSVVGTATGLVNGAIRTNTTAATQSANSGLWLCGNQSTSHYNWLIASQFNIGGALEITPSTAVDGATFTTPTAVFTQTGRVGIGTTSPQSALSFASGSHIGVATTDAADNGVLTIGGAGAASNIRGGYIGLYGNENAALGNVEIAAGKGGASTATAGSIILRTGAGTADERARIDSSGRVLVGTSAARTVEYTPGTAGTPSFQVEGNDGASSQILITDTRADGRQPQLAFAKTRNGAIVASGDILGSIGFFGDDGTDTRTWGGRITCQVDGTPGVNTMPGRLVFSTTSSTLAASPTPRMTIKSTGIVNIANAPVYADNIAATAGSLVAGDVYRTATGQLMITY